MPWPDQGYAAVAIEGIDGVVSSATEENPETPVPMASLTKVITALVLLERQPLAPGEDGPMYEFGWLDQQAANDLRWRNESALDVPVGGTLTYFQLLEGILMGSAGNYANKLVDQLWDYDRDAYGISVISWLERNGLENTVVVDATGISPDNRSTPSDMLRVSELALANPVIAEIVAQAETDIPGAGEVKNSHPLINETGIVGIKTGHLDTWESVSYNLTTAKDIDRGDDGVTRAYAAVMQQPNHDLQESISRDLLNAVVTGLEPIEALPGGTVVATVTAPWGAQTQVVTSQDAVLTLWNGEEATIDLGEFTVRVGDRADRSVGTATISGQLDETEVELRTTDAFTPPSIQWRLSHPLELLGIGG
nr:hypothetical protein [Microbacterium amylolyticum]